MPSNKQTISQRALRFIDMVIAFSGEVQRLGAFFDVVRLVCVDHRFGDPVKTEFGRGDIRPEDWILGLDDGLNPDVIDALFDMRQKATEH